MATIRKTTYRCDSCGKEVDSRTSLVQIRLEKGTHSQRSWMDTTVGAKADFCDGCENALLETMKGYFGEKVYETLRRSPPRVKKPKPVQK